MVFVVVIEHFCILLNCYQSMHINYFIPNLEKRSEKYGLNFQVGKPANETAIEAFEKRNEVRIPDGWLIVEDYATYSRQLIEALKFLKDKNKIQDYQISEYQGLGFVHVYYF